MSKKGSVGRLNRVLRHLMHVVRSKEDAGVEMDALYQKAASAVAEMKRAVTWPRVNLLADLVRRELWDEATKMLRKKFPRCDREDAVTEVILLVCTRDNFDMFLPIFEWIKQHQNIIRMQMWRIQELYRRTQPKGRAKLILAAFKSVRVSVDSSTKVDMVKDLHAEMRDMNQTKTFDEFCLFNAVKNIVLSTSNDLSLLRNLLRQELRAIMNAPECVHLLLSTETEYQRLRIINKKFGVPLSVDDEQRVYCYNSWDNQDNMLCVVRVDPDTALAKFCYKLDQHTWLKLDASGTNITVSMTGSQWMIKVLDEAHIQIFNKEGKNKFCYRVSRKTKYLHFGTVQEKFATFFGQQLRRFEIEKSSQQFSL
jgi:hypothetical protein